MENQSRSTSILLKSSLAELLASLPEDQRRLQISRYTEAQCAAMLYDWPGMWGRPKQLIPGTPRAEHQRTDWVFWLVLAGRGFGKTRVGAETTRIWAANPNERILMIAPTAADVRDTMIEGPGGLLQCYPRDARPIYEPSRRLITFPSGAKGIIRSADEPERLRGPEFTKFWADEICAWRFIQDAWDQIKFGFRMKSEALQGVITTTPKPLKVLKELLANPRTVTTRGSSYENRANLSETYFREVIAPYQGTRLGRQEINAEILEDTPGALWTSKLIQDLRINRAEVRWELVVRVVVAVDPGVSTNEDSDETGIVVAALLRSGHVLVLDDLSMKDTPITWARAAVSVLRHPQWPADRIIGEVNNGGDLVEANIRVAEPSAPFSKVWASRGKVTRAEPIATAYERGIVHHVGIFQKLEEEMTSYVPGGKSPNRMDALVYAVTELLFPQPIETRVQIGSMVEISPI
jgi:phage terminase large subunit-like protein